MDQAFAHLILSLPTTAPRLVNLKAPNARGQRPGCKQPDHLVRCTSMLDLTARLSL